MQNSVKSANSLLKKAGKFVSRKSPEILLFMGVSSMVSATVFAIRSTPIALRKISKRKRELSTNELSTIETVKTAAATYVPSAVMTGIGIGCIIGSTHINNKRNAALMAAYTLSEQTLKEYQAKMTETLTKSQVERIKDGIAKDKLDDNPLDANTVISTGMGDTLMYDTISGRYFYSSIEYVKKIVNKLNKELIDEMFVSQNDFFYELGLKPTGSGYELGWQLDSGLIDVTFSAQITENGKSCVVIQYPIEPKYKYLANK